ncbi:MAG: 23S rRNA (adenine(2503)-C(2))-methyltransferase RlmN [Elusimicrobia bacterium]|nr:23S rRNA (adenine(2503)-C(2))-methyltransferase RlmN [Elusimicrobiota bacterium]
MDAVRTQAALLELGQPGYRWEQVRRAVYEQAVSSYDEISVLPADARRALAERAPLLSLTERRVDSSPDGRARKALLDLRDGRTVETVLLRPSPTRWTTCISSQVGCAVACTFCATGLMGLARSLTPEEIADQVLFWRQYMKKNGLEGRLDNVVYMGMGEPFACYDETAESLRALLDQKRLGIGARHISVSTSGIAPKIVQFGRDFAQVNLALSLHAADDALRTRLVPMNKAYPLAKLAEALKDYLAQTNRKIFFEYVLLKGENDRAEDAEALARWLSGLGPSALLHVNLIVFNQTDTPHAPTDESDARRFQAWILAAGFKATVRRNLGRDIDGACGQLAVLEGKK